ncbi:phospholipase D family protein [Saccharopolyspora kobensis]|uniref:phospholipase D family protein n=1 Tax=Saccharopolyspora kobensis TaxID=146035 RepID=UPI001160E74F|nr:phospholipase D family protein [Saccharopolyspora kobensis]
MVDVAVGTTYSLDLTSLLTAPLSFALHDTTNAADGLTDPVTLLHALRRHAEHTTVFFQAGELAVPSAYRSVFAHLEDVAHGVTAPAAGYLFHPKLWALRFRAADGQARHRVVCLSRNLTADRSWDTVVKLDQADQDGHASIGAEPLRQFLRGLPGCAARPLPMARRGQVHDLVTSLDGVAFEVPIPFRSGDLLPLGLGAEPEPPDRHVDRAVVISPFLDSRFVAWMRQRAGQCTWVSRAETFERLGSKAFADDDLYVLQPQAEDDDVQGESSLSGLHAKVLVLDKGGSAKVITGSANATWAAWNGNAEFDVVLNGPSASCGAAALFGEGRGQGGLRTILLPYEIDSINPAKPAAEVLEEEVEDWLRALAVAPLDLHVEPDGEEFYLRLHLPAVAQLGTVRIAPAPLPFEVHAKSWAGELAWHRLTLQDISPYLAVEVVLERNGLKVTRRRLLVADLHGDVPDRQRKLLANFLRSKKDVLRLLVLLLGDEAAAELFAAELTDRDSGALRNRAGEERTPLFERLVRALARDHAALRRVDRLLADMASDPGLLDLLPDGFGELWQPVRQVWREQDR